MSLLAIAWLSGCGGGPVEGPPAPAPSDAVTEDVRGPWGLAVGRWSAWFQTDAGPVRVGLELDPQCRATVHVGDRVVTPSASACEAGTLSLRFAPYASSLSATIGPNGDTLRGHWTGGQAGLPFHADFPGAEAGWLPVPEGAPFEVALDVEGRDPALLTLRGPGPELQGSVATATGDWGPVAGGWTAEGLELHGFDGNRPLLVRLAPDALGRLEGHVSFRGGPPIAARERAEPVDLDGWDDLRVERVDLASVRLPRPGGEPEPLPATGPRVLYVTGSWCPNCSDSTPVIERLHREVPGLTVIGLAWENGAPPAKADRLIQLAQERAGATFPVYRLDALPAFIPPVPAFPTVFFVRADGSVSAAHTGFLGPSVGDRHTALVDRMLAEARALVAPPG